MSDQSQHFGEEKPLQHSVKAYFKGFFDHHEQHGSEVSQPIFAALDTFKDVLLGLLLFILTLSTLIVYLREDSNLQTIFLFHLRNSLVLFGAGWLIFRVGRSVWLTWNRLERLHRVLREEKYEIDHHRQQEKEELKALYAAKGFKGKLLDDVVSVLMANEDRLLKVMMEEELGYRLESVDHPIKTGIYSLLGGLFALLYFFTLIHFFITASIPLFIALIGIPIGLSSSLYAYLEGNRPVPAFIWNFGIISLAATIIYFISSGGS